MNEHTLKVLEFDKVKISVASHAFSEAGKDLVIGLFPALDQQAAAMLLKETREFTRILASGESAPLEGIPDTRQIVSKLQATGGILSARELLNAALMLAAGRRVKKFFQKFEGGGAEAGPAPLLSAKAARIRPLKEIEDRLVAAIDERAEIKDSASPELRKIRKQIVRMREEILGRMTGILQDSGFQKVIQEPVITLRDDRYVLPLKPGFRQSLQGAVHGQSGSRATLFVEPLQVLEQNNRLAELRMEEREEVERILRELTVLLSREADAVMATMNALAEIDCVHARARFGTENEATVPALAPHISLRLKAARHPLLVIKWAREENRAVLPNDIVLEGEQRALILSGPNAGGKTVILKTVGLLCVMAQSGIPITADEGSELPCFDSIFADIGDEQSIEQDLSTFSSHVSQIAEILQQADRNSLVLLDELGSGTEPGEGAGLGAAVLESLIGRGCVTLVTTHQNALKLFGSQTTGAVNAAMEFDPQTLKPTYRLTPGRPGRSYGLDMAFRLGIPDEVIQRARARLGQDNVRLEKLLEQVEEDERLLASERESVQKELMAARKDREEAEEALRTARDEAGDLKSKARSEAKETLAALRGKLHELSRAAALEPAEAKKISAEMEALESKLVARAPAEQRISPAFAQRLHSGDTVRIARLNKIGTVLASHRDILELEVGGKKIKLSVSEVVPEKATSLSRSQATTPGWGTELGEEEGTGDRLNIIGLRVPEGLAEVERFIDRAGLHHLTSVTIIHGLGTGALKNAVTDFLRNHPLIASFRPGEQAEGGTGVTVAELKK